MSSPPVGISYVEPANDENTSRRLKSSNELNAVFHGSASGQDANISITIGILDFYGNIANTESIYQATIYGTNKT